MTEQAKAPETVEIVEPKAIETVVIDEGQAEEEGLTKEEVEMGKKHGVIKGKEEGQKKEDEGEKDKENEAKDEDKKTDKDDVEAIRKKPLSEITDEEAVKLTKNEQGYYWAQKKERAKRQSAESDRDYYKMKIAALEEDVKKMKEPKKKEEDDIDALFDENGEEIKKDPEEPKLSEKEWKERQEKEQKEVMAERARINSRLFEFEAEAKEKYQDLDSVIDLTTDIFNNYKTIYKDPAKQAEIEGKIREWTLAAADMFKPNARNLSEMAYEIGKMHPNYKPNGKKAEIEDGEEVSEDKLRKLLDSPKGKTSASLSGGSLRVPISELTLEQARNLPLKEWRKLPKETKDRLLGKT